MTEKRGCDCSEARTLTMQTAFLRYLQMRNRLSSLVEVAYHLLVCEHPLFESKLDGDLLAIED